MFATLPMEQEATQCDIEEKTDEIVPGDLVEDADVEIPQNPDAQRERRESSDYGQSVAEPSIVRHQEATHDVAHDDRQTDEHTEKSLVGPSETDPILAAEESDEGEEAVEVEEPRRDLQCLRLHAVEPFSKIQRLMGA